MIKQKGLIVNIVLATLLVTLINIVGSCSPSVDYWYLCAWSYENDARYDFYRLDYCLYFAAKNFCLRPRIFAFDFRATPINLDVILSYIKHVFQLPMSFSRQGGQEIVSRFTDANRIIDALPVQSCLFSWMCQLCRSLRLFFFTNSSLFFLTLLGIPVYALIIFLLWSLLKRWIMRRWSK